jgi:hypothetical protein
MRFIALLLDCCKNQLSINNVRQFTKLGKPFIKGIALRNADDKFRNKPTILPENLAKSTNAPG